jgi:hypothetical protein
MTKGILLVIIAAATLWGCKKPEVDHLSHEKMENVLLDVFLAENASAMPESNRNFAGVKNMDTLAGYYRDILAQHSLTKNEFNASLDWYKNHQNELDTVLSHVIVKADKLLAKQQLIK